MSGLIKEGDLAQVVRGHECGIGRIASVVKLIAEDGAGCVCVECGADTSEKIGVPLALMSDGKYRAVWRLKRITPLSELEGEKRREEIEA